MRRGGMGHRKVRSPANLRGVSGVVRSLGCSSCNQGEQNTEHISKFRNWWHHRLSHRDIDRFSYDLSSSAIFISAAAATTIGFLRDIRFSVFPHPFCPSLLPAPAYLRLFHSASTASGVLPVWSHSFSSMIKDVSSQLALYFYFCYSFCDDKGNITSNLFIFS